MPSHKSKSGPCTVVRRFEPQPATPAQQRARLQHKLALLEDRIASKTSFQTKFKVSSKQLIHLLQQRDETKMALSRFGE